MKYSVRLQTVDMERPSKLVIVKLSNDKKPTPYNIISQKLADYYSKHREELNLKTDVDVARASGYDAYEMIDNLIYYEIKEIKE